MEDELKSGLFQTAEEVIGQALEVLRQTQILARSGSNGEQREAVRQMLAFVEKNHVLLEGTSVKDLIHEGHRL
ncbi:MAG: hypothetical protein WBM04_15255 [Candidatus Korobacteraceae bacterium]